MTITINGTTGIAGVDGSAGTPAIQGADTNTGMFFPAADTIAFAEGGAEVMRIDSSGNVGIGSTTPTAVFTGYKSLYLNGSSGSAIQMQSNGSLASNIVADSNALYLQNITAMAFATGGTSTGTERMRIDSNGRWMVNVTTALNGGTARGSLVFNGAVEQGLFIATSGANNGQCMGFNYNISTNVGSINITSGATSYATSSDYRLKENIAPMTGALITVAKLKPVTYKWKLNGETTQGFIAHELQEVVPECVVGEKDAVDAEGNPKYQGIDTNFLVATLTAAIQEQQALITALTARIEALETK
jgi:hypothetical protein